MSRARVKECDSFKSIAGNHVARADCGSTDRVRLRPTGDRDPAESIRDGTRSGGVCADEIAFDDIQVGSRAGDRYAVVEIAGDNVARRGCRASNGVALDTAKNT